MLAGNQDTRQPAASVGWVLGVCYDADFVSLDAEFLDALPLCSMQVIPKLASI